MRVRFSLRPEWTLVVFLLLAVAPSIKLQTVNRSAPPIRLDAKNPHYFLFQGKTVALITSGEHYGAVMNADFDYRKYLQTLAINGFNYTRLFGGSYVEVPAKSFGILRNDLAPAAGRFIAPWARSDMPGYSGGGNKIDLDQWNADYFARFNDFLLQASRRGIVVEIVLFSSHYDATQWNLSPFNPSNNVNQTDAIDWRKLNTLENGNILKYQESYARKLVREANPYPNVIFGIQNEPWADRKVLADVVNPYLSAPSRDVYPNSIDLPDELSLAWQSRVSNWITSEESKLPNEHLLAQDCCNFWYPVKDLLPGVSVVNFHYAYPQAVTLNYSLGKALSYDESGFLGRDDEAYVRQAWNFMLAGGSVFDNLDYSFTPGHEDGSDTDANGPGGGSPELRRQLAILVKFMQGLPLEDLTPDASVVASAPGVYTHAISKPNGVYAIYFDGYGPVDAKLNLPTGDYSAEWIDVHSGAMTEASLKSIAGRANLKTPVFKNGEAVVLTRAER